MSAEWRRRVEAAAPRIAALGNWPSWIDAVESLGSRIPEGVRTAPGFDTGIACALDLIPREKQRLSAILHAAYTEEAVEQVRQEIAIMDADTETTWWLAACHVCKEGGVGVKRFEDQFFAFDALRDRPYARVGAARHALEIMEAGFTLVDGIPFAIHDGGLQGAYIHGYDWGVQYDDEHGLFFIGTFRPTLGLETFPFSNRVDSEGRSMSGPVHGSKQFVKASSFDELAVAIAVVRAHLGEPRQ